MAEPHTFSLSLAIFTVSLTSVSAWAFFGVASVVCLTAVAISAIQKEGEKKHKWSDTNTCKHVI